MKTVTTVSELSFSFSGNVTLVVIFGRNKHLRNVPNTYIISLALGDLLVLVFTVPFVSTIYIFPSWPYGEIICKFSEFVKDVSVGVTVFTLTVLSVERYLAIVSPLPRVSIWSSGSCLINILTILIWLIYIPHQCQLRNMQLSQNFWLFTIVENISTVCLSFKWLKI